jgi:hypothetical protein
LAQCPGISLASYLAADVAALMPVLGTWQGDVFYGEGDGQAYFQRFLTELVVAANWEAARFETDADHIRRLPVKCALYLAAWMGWTLQTRRMYAMLMSPSGRVGREKKAEIKTALRKLIAQDPASEEAREFDQYLLLRQEVL